ncbi:MAG TPA: hypothetical protein VK644_12415 [Chitinophagaceae bacterium]|nr:hypothetical protein [Chitinophagaceae bacterium]
MTDLVYIVGATGALDHLELRHSIRSMQQHLTGIGQIVIVGHCPADLEGVLHIPADDETADPAKNIYRKILKACEDPRVSDHFLCASDDHFLLKDFAAEEFPNFYSEDLHESADFQSKENYYKKHLESTIAALEAQELPTLNYNVHCPILYYKSMFLEVMPGYEWNVKHGYLCKSLYANTLRLQGRKNKDLKFHHPKTLAAIHRWIRDKPFFSTSDFAMNNEMKSFLAQLFS